MRRVLGRDALTTYQTDVALAPDAGLVVDALELTAATAAREWDSALALYQGPFLDGVYVGGSAGFEQWSARERTRLETAFVQVCERRATLLARAKQWEDCATIATRWLDTAPLSTDAARTLLTALAGPDTREAKQRAVAAYDSHAARLKREFELAPDPSVTTLARDVARQLAAMGAGAADAAAAVGAADAAAAVDAAASDTPAMAPEVVSAAMQLAQALAAAGFRTTPTSTTAQPSGTPAVKSIAVLPFANMSNDPQNEYLAEGMSEEILNALARTPGLRVASRTSSFAFKGGRHDVRTIGARLNVGAVLEGSVRKAGNRLRVGAQLVNAADGYHVWSGSYDRELDDVFAIQDELAQTIVGSLRPELVGGPGAGRIQRYTDNVRAYDLYLRGRYHLNHITAGSLRAAIDCFAGAIAVDPMQAPAHAALASAYVAYALFGEGTHVPKDLWRRARAAATAALKIDSALADALGALGTTKWACDWDFAGAERDLQRAVELKPGDAALHNWHGWALLLLGRISDCLHAMERARDLEPESAWLHRSVVRALYADRQHVRAAEEGKRALERFPRYYLLHVDLASVLIAWSRYEDAIAMLVLQRDLARVITSNLISI